MDDLRERLREIEQNPSPDVWDEIVGRADGRELSDPAPSARRRIIAGLVAAVVAVGAFALVFPAIKGGPEDPGGAANSAGGVAEIRVSTTEGESSATWSFANATQPGVPVEVIIPGSGEQVNVQGPVAESLGLESFTLDLAPLRQVDLVPISIPSDVLVESDPMNLILFAFTGEAEQGTPGGEWSGKMTPLQPPTDLHWLAGGRWRIVVAGRGSDGALFQFAFELDVQDN